MEPVELRGAVCSELQKALTPYRENTPLTSNLPKIVADK